MAKISKNIPAELLRRSRRVKQETKQCQQQTDDEHATKPNTKLNRCLEPKIEPIYERIVKTEQITKDEKAPSLEAHGYLNVDTDELDLERTLLGGQSFRWTKSSPPTPNLLGPIFTGVVLDNVWQLWRVSEDKIAFRKLNGDDSDVGGINIKLSQALLEDYFHLRYPLKTLYQEWSSKDGHLSKSCQLYKGFRILRQDPVENVFSFICATNNNIKRITQMIDKLCKRFGTILPSEPSSSIYDSHYRFPSVETLAERDVFDCLRYELGFGYRAKFITETATQLMQLSKSSGQTPREYLLSLRDLPYKETCKQLMELKGIGRKVADCISLMSMDHLNSVPIDCHIYEIVCRHYMPKLKEERKSLTDKVHDLINSYFNQLHGPLAGWSTSILFIGELTHLKVKPESESTDTPEKKNKEPKIDIEKPTKRKIDGEVYSTKSRKKMVNKS